MSPENKKILESLKKASEENKFPSYDRNNGLCLYKNGYKRCAVGALLTEEELDLIVKLNKNSDSVCGIRHYCKSIKKLNESTLCNLQYIHDEESKNVTWDNQRFLNRVEKYLNSLEE